MALVGNLEELGLGEILPIIGLSKKTGVLFLNSQGKDGSVFFRSGRVAQAISSEYHQSPADFLLEKGVLDAGVLQQSRVLQRDGGFRESLGSILVHRCGVKPDLFDNALREYIEHIVFSLFSWKSGAFRFDSVDSLDTNSVTRFEVLQFVPDQCLIPQMLALDGSRFLAGKPLSAAAGDVNSGSDAVTGESDGVVLPALNQVVIVDDDAPTLRVLTERFTETGHEVFALADSREAVQAVEALCRSGVKPAVLIDMIMPRIDGSGLLGGIELLELLYKNNDRLQLIIMSDYHFADAEKLVHDRGIPFVVKPKRAEIHVRSCMDTFIEQISSLLHPGSS